MAKRKIIILTPVKNEDWILDRFLKVCSIFADHIVIADQNSTDRSLEIYPKYPKVFLIKNDSQEFNESERQLLLLNTARKEYGLGNILVAIDADEILAADAMYTRDWEKMLFADQGTILYFEKPTFLKSTKTSIRYFGNGWPLGYVDDGATHIPSIIHSTRIPTPPYAEKLYLNEIKFLHYALVRLDAQASKQRLYSMIENLKETKSLRLRRRHYNSYNDFSNEGDQHLPAESSWFENWEKLGIDMHSVIQSEYYWYDFEALRLFKMYGVFRFALDDIWDFEWEKFRIKAVEMNFPQIPNKNIKRPFGNFTRSIGKFIDLYDTMLLHFKRVSKNFFT